MRVNEPVDEALFRKPEATAPQAQHQGLAVAGAEASEDPPAPMHNILGEVLALSGGGSLITNITHRDLEQMGVADSATVVALVRGRETRLLFQAEPDFAAVSPGDYLATFNGTPALWLVKAFQGMRSDDSTYAAGDPVRLALAREDGDHVWIEPAPKGADAADSPKGE